MLGLAFASLPPDAALADIDAAVEFLALEAAPGRFAAVAWEVAHEWAAAIDVEGRIAVALLGVPEHRTEDRSTEPWMLHSNLFVRAYGGPHRPPSHTWQVLLLRRLGEPPYARIRNGAHPPLDDGVLSESTLDVTEPAFTRDVANNVWHVSDVDPALEIAGRLAHLTCWSDDQVVFLDAGRTRRVVSAASLPLRMNFVPVATKRPYEWEQLGPGGQIALFNG